jgi:hypothetical protein
MAATAATHAKTTPCGDRVASEADASYRGEHDQEEHELTGQRGEHSDVPS